MFVIENWKLATKSSRIFLIKLQLYRVHHKFCNKFNIGWIKLCYKELKNASFFRHLQHDTRIGSCRIVYHIDWKMTSCCIAWVVWHSSYELKNLKEMSHDTLLASPHPPHMTFSSTVQAGLRVSRPAGHMWPAEHLNVEREHFCRLKHSKIAHSIYSF